MKILFICSETKQMGVSQIMSYLTQSGHQTDLIVDPRLFDNEYIRIKPLNKTISNQKWSRYLKQIKRFKPDLIGFSVNTANYQWALEKAEFIKNNFNALIIFGGPHPTILPEDTLNNKFIDMVALGEAEESLLEYANQPSRTDIRGIWFKKNNQIIKNPLHCLEADLDKYPFPADEIFYKQLPSSYRWYPDVLSGRGCPYHCTFCNNATRKEMYQRDADLGPWIRQLNVDRLIKELIHRKERHKSKIFDFKNEVFSINDDWLREFAKEYKKYVNLPFYCYFSLNLVNEERISLLKKAGVKAIHFGLQSGCQRIRKTILHRYETNQAAIKGAQICHKYKVNFSIHCLLDLPFETEQDIQESINLFNKLRPSDISCYSLLYFPKSKIIDKGLEAGLLTQKDIQKINQGKGNMIPRLLTHTKENSLYEKYALFLSAIPIIPKDLVSKLSYKKRPFRFFQILPLSIFLPTVKFITMTKGGWTHLMPSIIYNELYNLTKHIKLISKA